MKFAVRTVCKVFRNKIRVKTKVEKAVRWKHCFLQKNILWSSCSWLSIWAARQKWGLQHWLLNCVFKLYHKTQWIRTLADFFIWIWTLQSGLVTVSTLLALLTMLMWPMTAKNRCSSTAQIILFYFYYNIKIVFYCGSAVGQLTCRLHLIVS